MLHKTDVEETITSPEIREILKRLLSKLCVIINFKYHNKIITIDHSALSELFVEVSYYNLLCIFDNLNLGLL
jgi:hypothetical protein